MVMATIGMRSFLRKTYVVMNGFSTCMTQLAMRTTTLNTLGNGEWLSDHSYNGRLMPNGQC